LARKLIIANGRGDYGRNGLDGHLYVCAESKAEAVRLLIQAGYKTMTLREFNQYWSKGCWGVMMKDITPEKGVWFVPKGREWDEKFKPIRLI
jgi:hypothetical protein